MASDRQDYALTLDEAARLLNRTSEELRDWVRNGKVSRFTGGGRQWVYASDIKPYVRAVRWMEKYEMQEAQNRIWSQYCDNCNERIGQDSALWICVSPPLFEGDDDPEMVHYCTTCISVDQSRRRKRSDPRVG